MTGECQPVHVRRLRATESTDLGQKRKQRSGRGFRLPPPTTETYRHRTRRENEQIQFTGADTRNNSVTFVKEIGFGLTALTLLVIALAAILFF